MGGKKIGLNSLKRHKRMQKRLSQRKKMSHSQKKLHKKAANAGIIPEPPELNKQLSMARVSERLSACAGPRRSSTVNPAGPRLSGRQSRGSLVERPEPFWKKKSVRGLKPLNKGQRGRKADRRGGVVIPNIAARFNKLRQKRGK